MESLCLPMVQAGNGEKKPSNLHELLPVVEGWKMSVKPRIYYPEDLFEYLDGAAEAYLAYDFEELIVVQYADEEETSLLIEIYDMGNEKNAFGIYSAERYPESKFLSVGNHGYLEEGTLNFIIGEYYVKLLCFEAKEEVEDNLKTFAHRIIEKVEEKGKLPSLLSFFPQEGRVANSEKFVLKNFLGYAFLKNGYLVNYKLDLLEFDCFIIEGEDEEDAQRMLKMYLEAKNNHSVEERESIWLIKDRYYHNIFLAKVGNYLCGILKIRDGFEEIGEGYLNLLIQSLER